MQVLPHTRTPILISHMQFLRLLQVWQVLRPSRTEPYNCSSFYPVSAVLLSPLSCSFYYIGRGVFNRICNFFIPCFGQNLCSRPWFVLLFFFSFLLEHKSKLLNMSYSHFSSVWLRSYFVLLWTVYRKILQLFPVFPSSSSLYAIPFVMIGHNFTITCFWWVKCGRLPVRKHLNDMINTAGALQCSRITCCWVFPSCLQLLILGLLMFAT